MLKALLWKEWRQNRVSFLSMYLVFLGCFLLIWLFHHFMLIRIYAQLSREYWVDYDNSFRFWGYYFICGLVAISMGALFADERAKKTLPFLYIQPVTRTQIWCAKVWFASLVIAFTFLFVMVFHRLFGAWWVWNDPGILRVYPYSLYVALAGFAIGLFMGVLQDNSTTTVITTVLILVLLYFGIQYFGKIEWKYVLSLFIPISVIFITLSYLIFCSPDYWVQPARKIWHRKVTFIAVLSFIISWIPFFISSRIR